MTNQQGAAEALRLADALDLYATGDEHQRDIEDAAAELRRLHAENERLAALVEAQQPAPSAAGALSDDLRDRLVAISEAIADQDDRAAQAMLREILAAPQPSPTPQADSAPSAASKAVLAAIRAANMQLVRTGDDEFMLVTYKNAKAQCDGGKCGIGGYCDDCPTPQADSQPAVDSPLARRFGGCPSCGRSDCVAMSCARTVPADLLQIAARAPADSVTAPAGWVDDDVDAIALARYKVVPAHESMFHRFAVVAGDGKHQLYLGREVECENMARKFAGAFLDGAFYQSNIAPTTPTAASIAWTALRDLTDPLGEAGVKIMGHVRIYAQRQYEAGLTEGRATPPAQAADRQPAPEYVGNGMFKGETIEKAAEHWANWCDVRCMNGLAEFLRVVAARAPADSVTAPARPSKPLPYEPTSAMLIAARERDPALPIETVRAIYWSMWRTAPTPPAQAADSVLAPAGGEIDRLRAQVASLTRDCDRQASKIAELIADLKFQDGKHREDRAQLQTIYEHQRGECWYWQGDGQDHLESLCSTLPVVIRADQLRALAPTPPAQAAESVLEDAAFEAVRKKLCALPRYSFVLDDDGLIRRVQDRTGNWIEFDDAHELFDPVAIDAARKQGANHD